MRKPFIAGNWKMNTDSESSIALASGLAEALKSVKPLTWQYARRSYTCSQWQKHLAILVSQWVLRTFILKVTVHTPARSAAKCSKTFAAHTFFAVTRKDAT